MFCVSASMRLRQIRRPDLLPKRSWRQGKQLALTLTWPRNITIARRPDVRGSYWTWAGRSSRRSWEPSNGSRWPFSEIQGRDYSSGIGAGMNSSSTDTDHHFRQTRPIPSSANIFCIRPQFFLVLVTSHHHIFIYLQNYRDDKPHLRTRHLLS